MAVGRARLAYLDAMGITVWQRREAPGAAPPAATTGLECLQRAHEPLARVVVEWPGALRLEPAHPAGGLLLKILAALRQPLERFSIYHTGAAAAAALADLPASGGPILLLAEGARPTAGADLVPLPTLARMLADPAAKRTAWARLRPLIPRLDAGPAHRR